MALVYWAVAVTAVLIQTTSSGPAPYRRPPGDYQQRLPAMLDKRVHDGTVRIAAFVEIIVFIGHFVVRVVLSDFRSVVCVCV